MGRAWEPASYAALALTAVGAIALRFYALDHLPGINGDEPYYAVHAHAWLNGTPFWQLRTGSHLPMNPLFFGPVVAIQALLPPTLWNLRLPALLLSLLSIALAYGLYRRAGRSFALGFALLVATLPIHVAYARFAWDAAALPTAMLLALAAATRLRPVLTALAFGLCVWVHPSAGLSLPIIAAPFIAARWPRPAAPAAGDQRTRKRWRATALVLLAAVVLGLALASAGTLLATISSRDPNLIARAIDPFGYLTFLGLAVDLLSGATVYRFVVGSLAPLAASVHFGLAIALLVPLVAAGGRALARSGRRVELGVLIGIAPALLAMYWFAGLIVLEPGSERYGLSLTVPACYALCACADALARTPAAATGVRFATALVAAAMLASFGLFYLAPLHAPDAQRKYGFRTGPIDPKLMALLEVGRMRDRARPTVVIAQDWWIYWPVRYLAPPESGVRISIVNQPPDYRFPADYATPDDEPANVQRFAITWADGKVDRLLSKISTARADVHGYESTPILRVHELGEQPVRTPEAATP